jgi:hypothetical protein
MSNTPPVRFCWRNVLRVHAGSFASSLEASEVKTRLEAQTR